MFKPSSEPPGRRGSVRLSKSIAFAVVIGLPCRVQRRWPVIGRWILVVLWMSIIFSASSDARSMQHSSRIFGPLIHWLFPRMGEAGVQRLVFVLRKCAHLTEYAILAVLVWMAVRPRTESSGPRWDWRAARLALIISAVYAATDELHQVFVPTRQGSVWDVLLDTFGAACGLGLVWLLRRREAHD